MHSRRTGRSDGFVVERLRCKSTGHGLSLSCGFGPKNWPGAMSGPPACEAQSAQSLACEVSPPAFPYKHQGMPPSATAHPHHPVPCFSPIRNTIDAILRSKVYLIAISTFYSTTSTDLTDPLTHQSPCLPRRPRPSPRALPLRSPRPPARNTHTRCAVLTQCLFLIWIL